MMARKHDPIRTFLYAITRNGISLVGTALTTAAAILFVSFFVGESLGLHGGPYLGILTFVIFPAIFVFGLALIPIGIAWHRRRIRRAVARGETLGVLPVIDLNLGRTRTILLWSSVSLALSFSIGWLIALPVALLVAIACLHNFSAIADSSVHSTVIAESVPPHILGAAYAVRSVVGFGTGVISPVVFGWALDLAGGGKTSGDALAWGIAWATLGLGGLLGPLATWKLQKLQR